MASKSTDRTGLERVRAQLAAALQRAEAGSGNGSAYDLGALTAAVESTLATADVWLEG